MVSCGVSGFGPLVLRAHAEWVLHAHLHLWGAALICSLQSPCIGVSRAMVTGACIVLRDGLPTVVALELSLVFHCCTALAIHRWHCGGVVLVLLVLVNPEPGHILAFAGLGRLVGSLATVSMQVV